MEVLCGSFEEARGFWNQYNTAVNSDEETFLVENFLNKTNGNMYENIDKLVERSLLLINIIGQGQR